MNSKLQVQKEEEALLFHVLPYILFFATRCKAHAVEQAETLHSGLKKKLGKLRGVVFINTTLLNRERTEVAQFGMFF